MRNKATDPVLRKFRVKFIAVVMAFVLVLLLAVLAVAGSMTYVQRVSDVNDSLMMHTERIGRMPFDGSFAQGSQAPGEAVFEDIPPLDAASQTSPRNRGDLRDAGDDPLVVTSAYILDGDGTIQVTISNSLSLDDDVVEEAMEDILDGLVLDEGRAANGKIPTLNLFYRIQQTGSGYNVALASGHYVDSGMSSLLRTLAVVETLAFLAFFALSILLSRWVVGPVERAWRQQRQFIADASHELKTPLTVIRANDSLLMAAPEASVASQMQWIESTETEASLMQDLVNDMLFLAQSEDSTREVVHSALDFSELVESTVLQFESLAFERGVMVDSEIASGVQVQGEAKSLVRLVGTLLDNASKYAEEGSVVKVSFARQGNQGVLRVNNKGAAIPAEDLPHLFDRFYRSDKARTHGKGGFGLGLAIAKSIVDEHRGSIGVASNALEGTTFTVALPAL